MLEGIHTSPETSANGSQGAYSIAMCRGKRACPFGLATLEPIRAAIESVIADSPWNAYVESARGGRIRPHDRLRIALSACPNGCSQPQIHDIGLIAALRPSDITPACTGCGLCEKTCREAAILVQDGRAITRPEACQACGECARICPVHAIRCEPLGFRLLLGGHMGRHPEWATELPGLYTPEQIPLTLKRLIILLIRETRHGERLSQTFARLGFDHVEHHCGAMYHA